MNDQDREMFSHFWLGMLAAAAIIALLYLGVV